MRTAPSQIGRYLVERNLAQGGMGAVFLGRDPVVDRVVAIKLMRDAFGSQSDRDRFLLEARSVGRLRHPNIVTLFDVGEQDGEPFLVMEYIEGETLSELITSRPLPTHEVVRIFDGLCAGLAYAHRNGIVHRDIKPANVIISPEATVKILDFGAAQMNARADLTETGVIVGTLRYMSPEQVSQAPLDHRTDVFSAGTVLYELLSGQRAFDQHTAAAVIEAILFETPRPLDELRGGIDARLVSIVERCLEKDREKRYPDCEAIRGDLTSLLVPAAGPRIAPRTRDLNVAVWLSEPERPTRSPPLSGPRSGPFRRHGSMAAAEAGKVSSVPSAADVVRARPAVRPSLRCDRTPQWAAVDNLADDGLDDLILIPGLAGQDHDHFVARIQWLLRADPPRSIVRVDWPARPSSRGEFLELLACALVVQPDALGRELTARLSERNVVLLHPCLRSRFLDRAIVAYYNEWLPDVLPPPHSRLHLKCVQPIEWQRESAAGEQWLTRLGLRTPADDSRRSAGELIRIIRAGAHARLRPVVLDELENVTDQDLRQFADLVALTPAQRDWFLDRIRSRRPRLSRDVFQAIDDYLPDARSVR